MPLQYLIVEVTDVFFLDISRSEVFEPSNGAPNARSDTRIGDHDTEVGKLDLGFG
jgi:hypothetical protein